MIIAKPCRFTSVIGNTTIAELESTPKDSDLVGRCQFSVYVTAAKVQREFGLFGVTSATVIAFLLGAALYTTAHYKKKTRPARPARVLP